MNILFEESGHFKAATVLSEAAASYQAELATGRRVKVKSNTVLLQFSDPSAGQLIVQAENLAQEMDIDFIWQCAPQEEFDFKQFATEYFGHAPNATEATALLLKLQSAPIYFHRKGKGHFRAASPEILQAALAGIAKRQREAEQQAQWAEHLIHGELPAEIAAASEMLAFKPDKNNGAYKALEQAAQQKQMSFEKLLLSVSAFASAYDLHKRRFLYHCFPRGIHFPDLPQPQVQPAFQELPLATAQAFSIDDELTTEIDDAFSVEWLGSKLARVGIHIAAPGLGIQPGDRVDLIARERLSTVYMPGDKITMLPEEWIDYFTLKAGKICPALSLYLEVDTETFTLQNIESSIERIQIVENLRHNILNQFVTEASIQQVELGSVAPFPFAFELKLLWQFAQVLALKRQEVRGKPEMAGRVDYNFKIEREQVEITPRPRDTPLDKIVSEMMIFANSNWGAFLAAQNVPGVYRVQTYLRPSLGKMVNTRMMTKPGPHQGLGVAQYAWSTSPLRRYADLINQWQLIACLQNNTAPFQHGDADLFACVTDFDATYNTYADFQQRMEDYWCLRWLKQEQERAPFFPHAYVIKEDLVRLSDIPLKTRLPGLQTYSRGTELILEIEEIDEVELVLYARCKKVLDVADQLPLNDEMEESLIENPKSDPEESRKMQASESPPV